MGLFLIYFCVFRRQPSGDEATEDGSVRWYSFGPKTEVINHESVSLSEAIKIMDKYLAGSSAKFESAEETLAASMFGFSRSTSNFIEISIDTPTQISCRTGDGTGVESEQEVHSREQLVQKIKDYFAPQA
jgi:hypothetical protein